MNKFTIHGDCEIKVEGNIVHINLEGPFNIEFFSFMHKELLAIGDQINKDHYAVILSPKGEAVIVDQAFKYHTDFLLQRTPKAVAINLENCETKVVTESICEKIYQQAGINHQFFNSHQQALHWLNNDVLA